MHRNFFLFKRQISEIESLVLNNRIIKCFTHRKDELVLHLKNDKEYFLRICINKKLPYLLLYNHQNVKTHHVHFFEELKGSKITGISIKPFDKLINIICGDLDVVCVFYGYSPNIILNDNSGHSIARFKKNASESESTPYDEYINPFSPSVEQIGGLINRHCDFTNEQFFKRFIKGFNTLLARELAFRCSLNSDLKLTSLSKSSMDAIKTNLVNMISEMHHSPAFIYEQNALPYYLSIVQINHLKHEYDTKKFASVNEAWKYFIKYYQITHRFNQLKSNSQKALKRRIGYLEKTLRNIQQSENIEKKKKLAVLKGNLLLTFSQKIQKGSSEVTLQNIFSSSPQNILVKLDPTKSATENAQTYFNKFIFN